MHPSRSAGFTLVELLTVVVILAILVGVVAPRLSGQLSRLRTGDALSQITADLHYARMLAVRSGRTVVLRPEPAAGGCVPAAARMAVGAYQIVVRGDVPRVVKREVLDGGAAGLCVEMNGGDSIAFNGRGLLHGFNNRTVWARHGSARDSLTISAVGRVLRRY
jgi:type IV fimbrial biogenesis protein FimT